MVLKFLLQMKERKRMAVPDMSSCVFFHFTRKFEDSERQYTWDNWIKISLLPSNLCCLVGMNFYAQKRHTLMVSFVAACLGYRKKAGSSLQ